MQGTGPNLWLEMKRAASRRTTATTGTGDATINAREYQCLQRRPEFCLWHPLMPALFRSCRAGAGNASMTFGGGTINVPARNPGPRGILAWIDGNGVG